VLTPVEGTPEQVARRLQLATGMELDEEGKVGRLDSAAWRKRCR
jgi:hypothetical protein